MSHPDSSIDHISRAIDRVHSSRSITSTLLCRVKEFDDPAWSRLVELFSPFVYCWFRRWDVSESDAPDLVQTVFMKVAKDIGRFHRGTPNGSFRGWLWRIARNVAVDHFRTPRPHPIENEHEIPDAVDPHESEDKRKELVLRVLDMIRGDFQAKTFEVFWRCEVDGVDTASVAAEFEMTPGAVREAKRRVKDRFRQEWLELAGSADWWVDRNQR